MKIWKIEDGDVHYVCAESADEAVDLVALYVGVTASEYDVDAVCELTQKQADAIEVHDEDEDELTTVGALARASREAEYLCGTVW